MAKPVLATPPDVLDALMGNPETVTVTIGGKERPFLLSVYGTEIATAAGHDPIPVLVRTLTDAFQSSGVKASDVDLSDPTKALGPVMGALSGLSSRTLSGLAVVIWSGLLPFDRSLSLDVLKATLTPASIVSVFKQAGPALFSFAGGVMAEQAAGDAVGEAEDGPGKV